MTSEDERKRRRERRYRNWVAKGLQDRKYRQRIKDGEKRRLKEKLMNDELKEFDGA